MLPDQVENHGAPGQQEKLADGFDERRQGRYVRLTIGGHGLTAAIIPKGNPYCSCKLTRPAG